MCGVPGLTGQVGGADHQEASCCSRYIGCHGAHLCVCHSCLVLTRSEAQPQGLEGLSRTSVARLPGLCYVLRQCVPFHRDGCVRAVGGGGVGCGPIPLTPFLLQSVPAAEVWTVHISGQFC